MTGCSNKSGPDSAICVAPVPCPIAVPCPAAKMARVAKPAMKATKAMQAKKKAAKAMNVIMKEVAKKAMKIGGKGKKDRGQRTSLWTRRAPG